MTNPSFRLSVDMARKRMLYPAITIAAPSVTMIELPVQHRGTGLGLERYYPVMLETDAELQEFEQFLEQPRSEAAAPDLLDRRPSALQSGNVLIFRYEPPAESWPWLLVCCWPPNFTAADAMMGASMARGCYTTEMFEHAADLNNHSLALLRTLNSDDNIDLRLIAAELLPPAGTA